MTVFLVGAGPGDPGLMTVRSRELIATADVILYDRLIPPGALDGARSGLWNCSAMSSNCRVTFTRPLPAIVSPPDFAFSWSVMTMPSTTFTRRSSSSSAVWPLPADAQPLVEERCAA